MDENELSDRLDAIHRSMKWFDSVIGYNFETEKRELNEKQANILQQMFNLFRDLNWQVKLNSYKQVIVKDSEPVLTHGCGTPVKISPVGKEYGGKTYFGILLGDIPLGILQAIDEDGNLLIERADYNPAIFVPELNKIIFGCQSWWGRIKKESDLEELITEETIQDIWYVKMLKGMVSPTTAANAD
jgi:hypothetical protein